MPTLRFPALVALVAIISFLEVNAFAEESVGISNQLLKVSVDPAKGTFAVQSLPAGKTFVKAGKLAGMNGKTRTLDALDKHFGAGQKIEVTYANGNRDELTVFPNPVRPASHDISQRRRCRFAHHQRSTFRCRDRPREVARTIECP
jgi:hypothetical protein